MLGYSHLDAYPLHNLLFHGGLVFTMPHGQRPKPSQTGHFSSWFYCDVMMASMSMLVDSSVKGSAHLLFHEGVVLPCHMDMMNYTPNMVGSYWCLTKYFEPCSVNLGLLVFQVCLPGCLLGCLPTWLTAWFLFVCFFFPFGLSVCRSVSFVSLDTWFSSNVVGSHMCLSQRRVCFLLDSFVSSANWQPTQTLLFLVSCMEFRPNLLLASVRAVLGSKELAFGHLGYDGPIDQLRRLADGQ